MSRIHRRSNEEGAALIMVLIFLTAISLVSLALITFEGTITRQSFSVRKVQNREVATNTALEWAVNSLRQGRDGFCQGDYTRELMSLNNRQVEIICKGDPGLSSDRARSFAVYLNNSTPANKNEIVTGGAGGAKFVKKNIVGPVYNGSDTTGGNDGWGLGAPLQIDGDVLAPTVANCPSGTLVPGPMPDKLVNTYGNIKACTVGISAVTPPTIPNPPAVNNPLPQVLNGGGCKVFSPGNYTTAPPLASVNFFQPGIYNFSFNKTWNIDTAVVGGVAWPAGPGREADQKFSSIDIAGQCPGLTESDPGTNYGVVFVLGDRSAINVRNQGRVELFGYRTTGTDLLLPSVVVSKYQGGTDYGVASFQVANKLNLTSDLISVGVAQPEFILHSGVFAPDSSIAFKGSNNAIEMIRNTVVAGRLELFASNSIISDNFGVFVPSGTSRRYVLMARSCPGQINGATTNACDTTPSGQLEPELCSLASVTVYDDDQRTVYVQNWRVDRDPSASDPATCSVP